MKNEAELFAACVDDRGASGLRQQPPERLQVAGLQGVDGGEDAGGGHLHEAELTAVGVLRDEFRVEADVRMSGETVDEVADL